jgi:hypothetical protein
MIDSLSMYKCLEHKVRITLSNERIIEGIVDFFESEWDSGCGEATIGIKGDDTWFNQSEIESIEIIDD